MLAKLKLLLGVISMRVALKCGVRKAQPGVYRRLRRLIRTNSDAVIARELCISRMFLQRYKISDNWDIKSLEITARYHKVNPNWLIYGGPRLGTWL